MRSHKVKGVTRGEPSSQRKDEEGSLGCIKSVHFLVHPLKFVSESLLKAFGLLI
jgi:hypothetical protein